MDQEFVSEINKIKSKFPDYEAIRDRLYIRAENKNVIRDSSVELVYHLEGDIALILNLMIGKHKDDTVSERISMSHLRKWGIQEEKVWEDAMRNTLQMYPPRAYDLLHLLTDTEYEGSDIMSADSKKGFSKERWGNCISNTERTYGATAVFLPGVAEKISGLLEDDFFAVFTSVHEVMVHGAAGMDVYTLQEVLDSMIQEGVVFEEEVLSQHVYFYNRKTQGFSSLPYQQRPGSGLHAAKEGRDIHEEGAAVPEAV